MFDEKFWIAISFVLLIVFLYKKIYGILSSSLNNKTSQIEDQLKQASIIKLEAQEIRDNYLKQKKDNLARAQQIIDNAEKHAKKLISEGDKELKDSVDNKLKQSERLIKEMEISAINEIRIRAIEGAVSKFEDFISKNSNKKELYKSSVELLKKAI